MRCFLVVVVVRLDRDLRIIERHHGVKRRWLPSDGIFQRTLRDVDQELRGQLIRRAQNEARERATLLNLKRRCNGNTTSSLDCMVISKIEAQRSCGKPKFNLYVIPAPCICSL